MGAEPVLISGLVNEFLQYMRYRKGAPKSTLDTYKSALKFFTEFTENCDIKEVTVQVVDDYALSLIPFNFKPKTYRNRLTPIRSFVSYLYKKDYTAIKPEQIELPKVKDDEAVFLNEEEQVRLLNSCTKPRDKALVLFILASGMRVSEVTNAQVENLRKQSLSIPHGKGGKPRIGFITRETDAAIRLYHATLGFEPKYLFSSARGKKLSRQYIARVVADLGERAELPKKVTPHTLRHSYATNLMTWGIQIEDLQTLLGHANISTTRVYMHLTNDYLKSKYDKAITQGRMEALT